MERREVARRYRRGPRRGGADEERCREEGEYGVRGAEALDEKSPLGGYAVAVGMRGLRGYPAHGGRMRCWTKPLRGGATDCVAVSYLPACCKANRALCP